MIQIIKTYYATFLGFPKPVRIFIFGALIVFAVFGIGNGIVHYYQNSKIERLQSENIVLQGKATEAETKAKIAEANAKIYADKATSLEQKINSLESKEKQLDEKIISSQKTSNNLKSELTRVRVSEPANVGTNELENKLRTRYSQANSNQ